MGVNTFAKPKIHPLQVGWAAGELESDKAKATDALQEFRYAVNAEYMGGFDGLHFLRNLHNDDVLQSLHLQFTTPLKPTTIQGQPAHERVPLSSLFELDAEQEKPPEVTELEEPAPHSQTEETQAPAKEEKESNEELQLVTTQAERSIPATEPVETQHIEDDVQSVASSPSSNSSQSSVSIPGPMRKSSLNLASLPPREPVRRPSGRQSPLKHAKNKLSAILKNGRDLIAASAATSAEAKASVLSLETTRESPTRQLVTVMSHSSAKDRDVQTVSDKRLEEARAAQERLAHQRAVERREAQQAQTKTPAQRQRERAERAKVSQEEQAREEAKKLDEIRRRQEEEAKNAGERKRAVLEQKKQRAGQAQAHTSTIGRLNSKEAPTQKTRQARLEAQRAAQQEQGRLEVEKREAELEAQRRQAAVEKERREAEQREAEQREAEQEAQRRREAEEEERRRAEAQRQQAELEEKRRQAELEEQRRQATLEEERRQAELEAQRRQAALEAEQRAKREAEELEAARRKVAMEEELRREREAERRRQAMEEEMRARQERQQRLEAQQRLQEQRRLEAEKREAAKREAVAAAAQQKAAQSSGSRIILSRQEQQRREAERQQAQQQTKNSKAQDETQFRANPGGAKGQQRILLTVQEQRRIEAERREAAKREAQTVAAQRAAEDQQRAAPPSTHNGMRTVLKKPSLKHQASQEQIGGSDSKRMRMSKDIELDQGKSLAGPPIRPSGGFKKSSLAQGPSGSSMAPAQTTLNKAKIGRPLDMAKVSKAPIPFAPNPNPAGPATFKTPARPPNPTTTTLKSAQPHKPSPIQNGDAIELPEIYTDDEDDDYDAELVPSWANTPNITEQLIRQETINPTGIFGPPQPLDMEAVFDRSKDRFSSFRKRTSSANWDSGDRLTVEEIRKDLAARKRLRKEGGWTMDMARDMS